MCKCKKGCTAAAAAAAAAAREKCDKSKGTEDDAEVARGAIRGEEDEEEALNKEEVVG